MMSADKLLAIDNGTQSVRALLFDLKGNLLAKSRVPIQSYSTPAPGLSEQDPLVFWKAVCDACQELWKNKSVKKESIAGVTLTTQRSTLINLGKDGQPLRPAITWMDQRRTSGLKPVGGLWGILFRLSGMTGTVAYLQAEAEGNWIQTNQPEIWKKTEKFLLLSGDRKSVV
jgi:sugar (pentulose or hexulose) kinase